MQEIRELYGKIISYQTSIGYNPNLGHIWDKNLKDMLRLLGHNTPEETIAEVDRTFMYSINFPPENAKQGVWSSDSDVPVIRELLVDWLLADQQKHGIDAFSLPIEESSLICHKNIITRHDKKLSGNFLRTLSIWHRVINYIGKTDKILELGAGCGHQARTFLTFNPDAKYIIFDLPETLCFSYVFLKTSFPDKKCVYATCPDDLGRDYDILFVPISLTPYLHGTSYDLFINTASMGEMNNPTIHHWVNYLQVQIDVKSMFVLNRFLNTVNASLDHAMERSNSNRSSLIFDSHWEMLHWEAEPSYTRCPYIDTLHSRYLEVIAKRPWDVSNETKAERCKKLLQEVKQEDWYRIENEYCGTMTMRDNVLVNDTSETGPLFKVWESIRMGMNHDNISVMIKLLKRLCSGCDKYFEELPYYEEAIKHYEAIMF